MLWGAGLQPRAFLFGALNAQRPTITFNELIWFEHLDIGKTDTILVSRTTRCGERGTPSLLMRCAAVVFGFGSFNTPVYFTLVDSLFAGNKITEPGDFGLL